jgi:ketosteroid isomerase-like protein
MMKRKTPMQGKTLSACLFGSAIFLGIATLAVPTYAADTDVSKCSTATHWQDAYNKGDAAAVAAMYSSDAIEVTPGGITVGPAAVKERVETSINKAGMKTAVITTTKCNVDATLKWSAGEWKSTTPQGPVGGYWTAIEAKDGDTWKIHNLTFNLTPPPAK